MAPSGIAEKSYKARLQSAEEKLLLAERALRHNAVNIDRPLRAAAISFTEKPKASSQVVAVGGDLSRGGPIAYSAKMTTKY